MKEYFFSFSLSLSIPPFLPTSLSLFSSLSPSFALFLSLLSPPLYIPRSPSPRLTFSSSLSLPPSFPPPPFLFFTHSLSPALLLSLPLLSLSLLLYDTAPPDHLQFLERVAAFRRQVSPVIQMLASSGLLATRSIDSNSSPKMIEKAHSSGYTPTISLLRRASVVFPWRTSLTEATATEKMRYRNKQ